MVEGELWSPVTSPRTPSDTLWFMSSNLFIFLLVPLQEEPVTVITKTRQPLQVYFLKKKSLVIFWYITFFFKKGKQNRSLSFLHLSLLQLQNKYINKSRHRRSSQSTPRCSSCTLVLHSCEQTLAWVTTQVKGLSGGLVTPFQAGPLLERPPFSPSPSLNIYPSSSGFRCVVK